MFQSRFSRYLLLLILCSQVLPSPGQQPASQTKAKFPFPEKLTYRVEWRLIPAGSATLNLTRAGANQWQTNLEIQSAGIMNRLYKVADSYKVSSDAKFCGSNSFFDAAEGKRHTQTRLTFDAARRKVKFDEADLIRNSNSHAEIDIAPCTHEIIGALTSMRMLELEPGKSGTLPITNGKKMVNARVEAAAKESIVIDGKTYQTVRYEAFLFDNVLYRRKGRVFIWLTDDSEHIPVQLRLQLGFPIGNVSVFLEKEEKG